MSLKKGILGVMTLIYFFQNSPSFHIYLKIPPTFSYPDLHVRNRVPLYAPAAHGNKFIGWKDSIPDTSRHMYSAGQWSQLVDLLGNMHIQTFHSI